MRPMSGTAADWMALYHDVIRSELREQCEQFSTFLDEEERRGEAWSTTAFSSKQCKGAQDGDQGQKNQVKAEERPALSRCAQQPPAPAQARGVKRHLKEEEKEPDLVSCWPPRWESQSTGSNCSQGSRRKKKRTCKVPTFSTVKEAFRWQAERGLGHPLARKATYRARMQHEWTLAQRSARDAWDHDRLMVRRMEESDELEAWMKALRTMCRQRGVLTDKQRSTVTIHYLVQDLELVRMLYENPALELNPPCTSCGIPVFCWFCRSWETYNSQLTQSQCAAKSPF